MGSIITGWGKCLPPAVLSNDDLATIMDTSDEWISSRTGIRSRRISHVSVTELSRVAGARAIAAAGLQAADIDAVILATSSPDLIIPNTASRIQLALGIENAAALDTNAGCCGFIYALATADGLIRSGVQKKVLVVCGERLSFYLDWTKRDSAVIFGDGAGAVVLEPGSADTGLLASNLGCDPVAGEALMVPDFGTSMNLLAADVGHLTLQFDGQEIFKRAVRGMQQSANAALEQAGLQTGDCALMIPHQANIRIIEAASKRMGMAAEQVVINLDKYGNTSAASIPIALVEALEAGRIAAGDNLLLAAFGAGLTRAGAVIRWSDKLSPTRNSDASLPDLEQTALQLIEPAFMAQRQNQQANPPRSR